MSNQEVARQITADINAWAERMRYIGELVPDFWDELNVPDRLGEWLAHSGVIATTRAQAEQAGVRWCIAEMTRHARLDSTGDETKAAMHIVVNWLQGVSEQEDPT